MPKTPVADAVASTPTTFELTLDEFCARASANGETVEMLAGFHAYQTRHGRVKDTEDAFAADLSAFATAPA